MDRDRHNQDKIPHAGKSSQSSARSGSNEQYWNTVLHKKEAIQTSEVHQKSSEAKKISLENLLIGTGQADSSTSTKPKFPCSHCSKVFERKGHLSAHIESVHFGKRSHECHDCGKHFGHRSSLQRHVKKVHDNPEHPNYQKTTERM